MKRIDSANVNERRSKTEAVNGARRDVVYIEGKRREQGASRAIDERRAKPRSEEEPKAGDHANFGQARALSDGPETASLGPSA